MSDLHHLAFDGHVIPVLHRPDGVLLLEGPALAQVLGYEDDLKALHEHCRIEGIAFGNQPRPTIWIDVRNAHHLAYQSGSPKAERLLHWISHWLLPHFSSNQADHYHQRPKTRREAMG
ncbi:BRO-N domain-containing protein [Stutzerimonas azotifigens]|uniref:hypothetical protein n=1 Tax=Stutzerimonas azotifigens TaxID=291995 RepID=UPI0003FF9677|nr:hypothetical protein [Stutzerimonas azotifigens]